MHLQQVLRQINCDNTSTTTHTPQIKTQYIPPQLILINNHSRQRRGRVKQATIHNKNPYILRRKSGSRREGWICGGGGGAVAALSWGW
ncbi:hypothetical protein Leryth_011445 [Lithospermum erythrorhizon]|nr:hypothetical protein Leryth_011445 [Lithospermum erythrorhizon]